MARRLAGLVAALALSAGLAATAGAHVVSDRELVTLRKLEAARVRALLDPGAPDSATLDPGARAAAVYLLAEASARGDSALAVRAWRGIQTLLDHQAAEGRFALPAGTPPDSIAERRATARWAGALARAMIAFANGKLLPSFRLQYATTLPKLERTVRWLMRTAPATYDAEGALVDAQVFLLADGTYHDPEMGRLGQAAVVAALAAQRPGGAFTANGSVRVQARAVSALHSVVQYFPAPSLERSLTSATAWLARQVASDGRTGRPALADASAQREVALALVLAAARGGDPAIAAAAERAERRARSMAATQAR